MAAFNIGDRVSLNEEALFLGYIASRKFYTNMYAGKKGTIIGFTQDLNKIAVEFDDIVFTRPDGKVSSHDNGCHGRGKQRFCWYIPIDYLDHIDEISNDVLLLL